MNHAAVIKFEAYLLTEKRVSQNTFTAYKRDVAQFTDYLRRKKIALEDAKVADIKQFLQYLHKQKVTARTMARKISTLKAFFGYAHRYLGWDHIAQDISFPKIDKTLPSYLPEDEVEKLLNVADRDRNAIGVRNKVMLYVLYVTGMRISELTHLKLSDIHFDTGFIAVHGKGGKGRMVPLPEPIQQMLKAYINTAHKSFLVRKKRKLSTEYLFPVCYGGKMKPISRQAFWNILKHLWAKTGIKRTISPHKLRHSLATHMLKNGADLRSLQMLLGHENLSTVQIYTHLETSYLRKIYDKKHPRS